MADEHNIIKPFQIFLIQVQSVTVAGQKFQFEETPFVKSEHNSKDLKVK